MSIKVDVQLDAKGLACPMPIVKTKKAMNQLEDGQILEVQATDKGAKADLSAWAETVGHQYIGTMENGQVQFHYIRKCSNEMLQEVNHELTVSNIEAVQGAQKGGLILDVREQIEYAFGHIEGSKSIPMGELASRIHELNKDQEIYIICRTGKRSDLAAQKLTNLGFARVYNVLPGMKAWTGEVIKSV